ncbi:MAG: hypothetical protein M1837_001352 [Sclerophora amabilis]|nr:MAG: hypothetical protein M1837_001352 [Sclerophora amabilis]
MNNNQFRRLVLDTPTVRPSSDSTQNGTKANGAASPATLGSRMRSSMPMTPRSVLGSTPSIEFARQLAERNAGDGASSAARKFRSAAAPKGTKLPTGYRDRIRDRSSTSEGEDGEAQDQSLAARVQALEETMKLGQIDRATFEKLRDQITGGKLESTHLVKGLDYKLLERVKKGEDVFKSTSTADEQPEIQGNAEDVDEEFEKLEEKELAPIVKEKAKKKSGEMAPPPVPIAGKKRSRDEILAELKASRQAAAAEKAAAQPSLGPKFRKVGAKKERKSRIERDEKGREVLITVDEDGRVKRKVRRAQVDQTSAAHNQKNELLMPDTAVAPLGMEVPAGAAPVSPTAEAEDVDIFEGVGEDYDPLAGLDEDDSTDEEGETPEGPPKSKQPLSPPSLPPLDKVSGQTPSASPPPLSSTEPMALPTLPQGSRNYFGPSSSSTPIQEPSNPLTDPTILAALHKASSKNLNATSATTGDGDDDAAERRARLLASHDRDDEDMDLGFGSSRFGDEDEEGEAGKIKLSVWGNWKGGGGEGKQDGDGKGGTKRKRGPKKRKGDKDSAADVMKVMEGRKSGAKG